MSDGILDLAAYLRGGVAGLRQNAMGDWAGTLYIEQTRAVTGNITLSKTADLNLSPLFESSLYIDQLREYEVEL